MLSAKVTRSLLDLGGKDRDSSLGRHSADLAADDCVSYFAGNHKPTFEGFLVGLRFTNLPDSQIGGPGREAGGLNRQSDEIRSDDAGPGNLFGMRRAVDDRELEIGRKAQGLFGHVVARHVDNLERRLFPQARPCAGGSLLVGVDQEDLAALGGETGGDVRAVSDQVAYRATSFWPYSRRL
jgi:hypothetical protein